MQTPEDPNAARIPEMVAATTAPFFLTETTTHTSLAIHAPTGPALLAPGGTPRRVFLKVENITSESEVPTYEVYLNLPPGAGPGVNRDRRAGNLSMFGLIESSRASETSSGSGLTYSFDVTGVVLRLIATREWDGKTLRVSFVPEPWPGRARAQVGRLSLYFE
jgi:tyrosinase